MTDEVRRLSRRRAATDLVATVLGATALCAFAILESRAALYVGAYGLLFGTSTAVVTACLTWFTGVGIGNASDADASGRANGAGPAGGTGALRRVFTGAALESDADVEEDTGWLIGRLENVLVFTLVLVGEYTALSIIFAAKSWVRREDTARENTTYYLAGTLVNFTYSIAVGMGTLWVLEAM